MITLSEFLGTIPCAGNAAESVKIAIREAKRLESLETPRVEAERTPLVDEDGDNLCLILDDNGNYVDYELDIREAECTARYRTENTSKPHTACKVMAPESGECPTVPVVTYTPTPERPHEWVIYLHQYHLLIHRAGKSTSFPYLAQRFPTAAEAQTYIDAQKIEDAYPWPVPKLTTAS